MWDDLYSRTVSCVVSFYGVPSCRTFPLEMSSFWVFCEVISYGITCFGTTLLGVTS